MLLIVIACPHADPKYAYYDDIDPEPLTAQELEERRKAAEERKQIAYDKSFVAFIVCR